MKTNKKNVERAYVKEMGLWFGRTPLIRNADSTAQKQLKSIWSIYKSSEIPTDSLKYKVGQEKILEALCLYHFMSKKEMETTESIFTR